MCKFLYLRSLSEHHKFESSIYTSDYSKGEILNIITLTGFPHVFSNYNITSYLFNEIYTTAAIYPVERGTNPIQAIINIIMCCTQIFRYSAEPYLRVRLSTVQHLIIKNIRPEFKHHHFYKHKFHEIEHLENNDLPFRWWIDVNKVNNNGLFSFLFNTIFKDQKIDINGIVINLLDKSDLSECNLINVDMRGIPFISCKVHGVHFEGSIMDDENSLMLLFEEAQISSSYFEEYLEKRDYKKADAFLAEFI